MLGSALPRLIFPLTETLIVSESLLLPDAHSPTAPPDVRSLLAARIASRNVQRPSDPLVRSAVLLTTMVLPAGRKLTSTLEGPAAIVRPAADALTIGWFK